MKTVGAFEAKAQLSRLLDEVEKGAEITITKHGRPVAKLVPAVPHDAQRVAEAIARLKALRFGPGVDSATIKQWIEEGRR